MEKRYALLIDAENAEIKYLDNILNEIKTYGNVTYKRMYGDFTSFNMKEWNERALEYAIVPIQQPHYTKSKNAADIMLVIDAMDILYGKNVDGFCIVSNDSDYTRLVNRLCEAGMEVIGMGSGQASKTLKAACTEFKNLEKIFSDELEERRISARKGRNSRDEKNDTITSLDEIKETIEELILKNERAGLGGIKSTLQRRYPDFDERNYGFSTIRKFVESMKEFQIIQENSSLYVSMTNPEYDEKVVNAYIRDVLKSGEVEMGVLSNKVHEKFEGFNHKNYGYSQFSKFISAITGIGVKKEGNASYVHLDGQETKHPSFREDDDPVSGGLFAVSEDTPVREEEADVSELWYTTKDDDDDESGENGVPETGNADRYVPEAGNADSDVPEAGGDAADDEPVVIKEESVGLPKQITRRIFTRYLDKQS